MRAIYVRRSNIGSVMDLGLLRPTHVDVASCRLKVASSPTGTYTKVFDTNGTCDFLDPTVDNPGAVWTGDSYIRCVFNPSNYGLSANNFWLKVVYLDSLGAELVTPSPSDPLLVNRTWRGNDIIAFTATAPVSPALSLDLPRSLVNFQVKNLNTSGVSLYLALGDGLEQEILAGATITYTFGTVSRITVRGDGSTAAFSVSGAFHPSV